MTAPVAHILSGRAHVYGDNVDTDRIIPGKYTKTLDKRQLAAHVLEDLDPAFRVRVRVGDFVVAGDNFGCGSSREQAPIALQAAGVSAILARSFAAIFYRNAINIGLPLLEIPDYEIVTGDLVHVDLDASTATLERTGTVYTARALPPVMVAILRAGGLVPYLAAHGDFVVPDRSPTANA